MAKVDTVGEKYYKPLKQSDSAGELLFWLVAVLSIVALFVDKNLYPQVAAGVQIALSVLVLLFFVQGQVQRLYLFPRAEDQRRRQLLSDSFGVTLTHEEAVGYYNNDQTIPIKRLAASVMESTYFTSKISEKMLALERTKTLGFVVIYFVAILNRSSNLELLAVAAQTLFGGEIIARWLKLEWLRNRSEQAYNNFNRLFTGRAAFRTAAQSEALDLFAYYETTKSTAAVLLSSKLFEAHNAQLTKDWEAIRQRLGL